VSATGIEREVGTRFVEALSSRDYEALGACFAADGTLRGVVPPGLREADGREAIVERLRIWTADVEEYEIADSEVAPFADMLRLRWVVQGVDPELGLNAYEQTAYAELADGEIVRCASPARATARSDPPSPRRQSCVSTPASVRL
jgi:hypothetical protein